MSDNGSVAPKERVNILYKPATGDAKEEVELPLKVLVLSDFTKKKDKRVVEDRKPIDIDKSNFNEVMENMNLTLDFNVSDKLSGVEGEELPVKINIKSMRDFQPENLGKQVPELKKIIELRQAIMALKGPMGNIPSVRKTIQGILENDDTRKQLIKELGLK